MTNKEIEYLKVIRHTQHLLTTIDKDGKRHNHLTPELINPNKVVIIPCPDIMTKHEKMNYVLTAVSDHIRVHDTLNSPGIVPEPVERKTRQINDNIIYVTYKYIRNYNFNESLEAIIIFVPKTTHREDLRKEKITPCTQ